MPSACPQTELAALHQSSADGGPVFGGLACPQGASESAPGRVSKAFVEVVGRESKLGAAAFRGFQVLVKYPILQGCP
jgi:hypothetical protein